MVTNLAHGGDGVARDELGRVLFIPGVLPNEEVHVVEVKSKKKFAHAKLLGLFSASPDRVDSPCAWSDRCGGCDLLHVRHDAQMKLKAHAAYETLERISGVDALPQPELVPASQLSAWRVRATVRARRLDGVLRVGMLERGSHRLVAFDRCMVLVKPLQDAMRLLEQALHSTSLEQAEFFMELASERGEVVMTIKDARSESLREVHAACEALVAEQDFVRGVAWRVPDVPAPDLGECEVDASVVFGRCPQALASEKVPAGLFRQAHIGLAGELVDHVVRLVETSGTTRVLELFAGCGNFTFPMAARVERVHAVEGEGDAVHVGESFVSDDKVSFQVSDLGREDWRDVTRGEHWPTVVLDPPRNGAKEVCEGLAQMADVERIIYVACEPGSLARDLGVLCKQGGFRVSEVTMYDMFPGTAHVETVVYLVR